MDPTEHIRRQQVAEINSKDNTRKTLEAEYGQVWTTQELSEDFKVLGFMAPYVVVQRKSDSAKGSLQFCHSPRFYFNWKKD